MSRRTFVPMMALALLAAPAAMQAQATGTQQPRAEARGQGHVGHMGQTGRMNPARALLNQRAELGLNAQQAQQLEAIATNLDTRNRPLIERLNQMRPQGEWARRDTARAGRQGGEAHRGPGARGQGQRAQRPQLPEEQRKQMTEFRQQAQPIMAEIRTNTQAANTQAMAVLTADQRQRVEQRRAEMRKRMQDRRGQAGPRSR